METLPKTRLKTRAHTHEEIFAVPSEDLFALLHTPSAICEWWGAARAVVIPETGGIWVAAWGEDEDAPDYVTAATIRFFDPPCRMVFDEYRYLARTGPLPFDADFVTEFEVIERHDGALLRVTQDGFPAGIEGDEYYAACEVGWRQTFGGIRRFLEARAEVR